MGNKKKTLRIVGFDWKALELNLVVATCMAHTLVDWQ